MECHVREMEGGWRVVRGVSFISMMFGRFVVSCLDRLSEVCGGSSVGSSSCGGEALAG